MTYNYKNRQISLNMCVKDYFNITIVKNDKYFVRFAKI